MSQQPDAPAAQRPLEPEVVRGGDQVNDDEQQVDGHVGSQVDVEGQLEPRHAPGAAEVIAIGHRELLSPGAEVAARQHSTFAPSCQRQAARPYTMNGARPWAPGLSLLGASE